MLRDAVAHFGAGRAEEADALCGDILAGDPDHVAALHLSAVIAFVSDRAAAGAVLLNRVFGLVPDHGPAFATLGDALAVKGERDGAVAAFQRGVGLLPQDAGLHVKLGVALCEVSRFTEAEAAFRRAIALDPALTRAWFNLAVALAGQQRLVEAEAAYREVIARDCRHRGVWQNLGNALADQTRFDEAITAYRRGLEIDSDNCGLHCSLGGVLYRQGRLGDAIRHYRRATALDPGNMAALRLLALVLHEAGEREEAVRLYRQITARDPSDHVILNNLGACLFELGRLDEAIACSELALALNPDHAPAHTNLGIIFEAQNLVEAAVAAHRRAVDIDPDYAKGYANLAVALRNAGDIDAALAASRRAIALDPELPLARYNHAHFLLMNGEFEQGFQEYQWRRKAKMLVDGDPVFGEPEWQGEPLAGRTLLLFAEYGLGDAINFVRYVPEVAASGGGRIILQVQPALASLLRPMLSDVAVFARGEPLPPFDLQLPLLSLPRIFGTTVETIPAAVPYLHPDPVKLVRWRQALADVTALKVGVVWAGNPRHKGDRQRSLSAAAVLPRLIMPGVQLYSLQKEPRPDDTPVLARLAGDVVDLAPTLGDFADTAAAICALDLVIAVDTSVAHLAGALGRPVWMLCPYALDWRWLRDRADTPWYPTMRLFRQDKPQAWERVLTRLSAELARVAAGERTLMLPARG
ncbi:tetratricopeptide repeat protein [Bradyrhizobium tropiciagri]|uniref:tetratricopeptide repeat protein n=1 Tax=Bradyrhizobium tropiciagri TaxID=312253 RepID=UPI001BA8AB84|nr:tetratricopeptide repeat protein [Bradyrhizobium tropiciagri]MBR0869830.1 tetratricopeptide repeat protein [Bradyrhizobium tropiciagri]